MLILRISLRAFLINGPILSWIWNQRGSLACERCLFCPNNIHPFCSRQICTTGQEYLVVYWSSISVLDITKCQLPCLINTIYASKVILLDFSGTNQAKLTLERKPRAFYNSSKLNASLQKLACKSSHSTIKNFFLSFWQ